MSYSVIITSYKTISVADCDVNCNDEMEFIFEHLEDASDFMQVAMRSSAFDISVTIKFTKEDE